LTFAEVEKFLDFCAKHGKKIGIIQDGSGFVKEFGIIVGEILGIRIQ
jgi:hypothetical protein